MTPTPPPSLIPAPPNFAVPEFVFPNLIPGKPRLPASFQLWPEVNLQSFPVTPPIPPTVQTGDVITASHENTVSTAISDLWIDLQSLAGIAITDPTSAKGDLIVRGISALGALAVGANGTLLTADTSQPLGIRWATVASTGAVPSTRQVLAGAGMTGGGPLSADVTLNSNVWSVNGHVGAVVLTSADISGAVPATRQIIAGTGLTGGGPLSADVTLAVAPDTTVQRIRYSYNATLKGTRPEVNLIPGANVTLSVADNPGSNRIDVTVAAAGGGSGGMVDPTTVLGDLIVRGTSTTVALPVGTADGQVLTVDHTAGVGIKWAAPTAVGVPTSRKINTTLPALAGGGDLTADLTLVVMPDSIVQQTRVSYNGALVGTRRETNFIPGTGVTLTVADDTTNNRVNVTIAASATGGGPQTPWTSDINAAGFTLYSAGKVGIGIATPQAPLHVVSSAVTAAMIETTATSGGMVLLNLKTANYFWQMAAGGAASTFPGSWYVYDQVAAAARLMINSSGNVGIGSTDPRSLLQVGSGIPLAAGIADFYGPNRTLTVGTSLVNILSTDAMALDKGGTLGLGGVGGAANPYAFAVLAGRSENNSYAGYFQISTMTSAGTPTERLRVTSAGNVGIGLTNPTHSLEVVSPSTAIAAIFGSSSGAVGIGQSSGVPFIQAYTSTVASGGANLCIQPAGNVGIATTNPQALLHLSNASTASAAVEALRLDTPYNTNDNGAKIMWANAAQSHLAGGLGIVRAGGGVSQDLVFYLTSNWTTADPTEKIRFSGSGSVGIGTSNFGSGANVVVFNSGATALSYIGGNNAGAIALLTYNNIGAIQGYNAISPTAGTALALQPSGGNVGVGNAAPGYKLDVTGDVNCTGAVRVNGVALVGVQINNGTPAGSFTFLNFNQLGGILITNGGISGPNSNTITINFGQSSDLQLKRNVQPLTGGLSLIERLRPITAEWNGLANTREGQRLISVVAQDLQAVMPDAVHPFRAKLRPNDSSETELLGIEPMAITAHLILAVQQLERRLKALEN